MEYLPVAREVNLTRTIERLKKEGVWIGGTAMNGEDYRKVDFSGPKALVIGSEGEGMSRLVGESCDKVVTLPMKGKIRIPERVRGGGHSALRHDGREVR